MRNLLAATAASTAMLVSANLALADGMPSLKDDPVPVVVAPSWSGFYFGGSVGYGDNDSDNNYSENGILVSSINESADGGLVSTILGYDRQIHDRFLIGLFADFDVSDITRGQGEDSLAIDRSWAIGARLGYLLNPTLLLFVTGGYTEAHFDNGGYWDISPALRGRDEVTFSGYFVGAGFERTLGNNFYLRGEARYADFGGEVINSGVLGPDDFVDIEEPELWTGRLGITYKLGRPSDTGGSHDWTGGIDHGDTYKVVSFSGVDVAKDSVSFFSGSVFALNGDFERDGLVFRTMGLWGNYDYGSGVPGVEIDVEDRSLDAMLGYQRVFENFTAIGYAGYDVRDIDLDPDDPTNTVRGTKSGFKVAADIETDSELDLFAGFTGSYSTAFDTYYAELRLGYNMKKFVVGAEGVLLGDDEDESKRLGGFATFRFDITPHTLGELTVNGGYQFVDEDGGASRSGGEGGYVGSTLVVAF